MQQTYISMEPINANNRKTKSNLGLNQFPDLQHTLKRKLN